MSTLKSKERNVELYIENMVEWAKYEMIFKDMSAENSLK